MTEEVVQVLRSNVGINSLELESRVRGNSGVFKRQGIKASIQKEKVRIGGEEFVIRRLFIKTATSGDYSNVGWVLDEDVARCMICAQQFSVFVSRTHCYACGNLVCGSCRDNEATVYELEDLPPQKVCNQCFWGQVHYIKISSSLTIHNLVTFCLVVTGVTLHCITLSIIIHFVLESDNIITV
jgi:hypothetical protein